MHLHSTDGATVRVVHDGVLHETRRADWTHPEYPDGTPDVLLLVSPPLAVDGGEMRATIPAHGSPDAQALFAALVGDDAERLAGIVAAVEARGGVWQPRDAAALPRPVPPPVSDDPAS